MQNNTQVGILRIFISSTDYTDHSPLYEDITFRAKKEGLAGVTVLKGMLGFGASSVIHSNKFWELSEKVPTVIEMIDEENKLLAFYNQIRPGLESMKYGCLVTFDKTTVLLYKSGQKKIFDS
ncbi:MAG: DUF190 domain-containing protein [Prolixibacteraceae bacterium]